MEQTETELDLFELMFGALRSARRLWIWLLALVVAGAGMFGYVSWRGYRPVYEASVSFTVRVANPLYASVNSYNEKTAEQLKKTFPYILTSTALQHRVREYLDIGYVPGVSASVLGKSNIFVMTVRDSDPQRANEVLEAVIACYPEVAEFVVGQTELILLDASGVPEVPVNSFRLTSALTKGVVVGFALWLVLCVCDSMLRATVLHEGELKKLLNIPCICSIPVTKTMRKREYPLISRESSKSGFAEAIRMLRLRIEKKLEQSDKKVLMVTSAKPGEGKTTVTVNLGISLAHSGKKVLIIDCDMFKPSAAKALQSRFGTGKVKIPLPESGMTATVCGIAVKNLYTVVFSGPGGTAPKQIGTADLKYLLKQVKGPFDCILLDTPPCALIGETMEVAEAADYGLLVVRQDYVSKNKILEGTRLLADCGLPLMGCVFNGIEGRLTPGGYRYGYGYGYGYGYSHSYGYGYGEDRHKKPETV